MINLSAGHGSIDPTDANRIGCEEATPDLEVTPEPRESGPTRDVDLGIARNHGSRRGGAFTGASLPRAIDLRRHPQVRI
ncbi:hypothetical protein GCM10027073_32840 [Streptomyces chlorus]